MWEGQATDTEQEGNNNFIVQIQRIIYIDDLGLALDVVVFCDILSSVFRNRLTLFGGTLMFGRAANALKGFQERVNVRLK